MDPIQSNALRNVSFIFSDINKLRPLSPIAKQQGSDDANKCQNGSVRSNQSSDKPEATNVTTRGHQFIPPLASTAEEQASIFKDDTWLEQNPGPYEDPRSLISEFIESPSPCSSPEGDSQESPSTASFSHHKVSGHFYSNHTFPVFQKGLP